MSQNNFNNALSWVRKTYPELFLSSIAKIELVKSNSKFMGLHQFGTGGSHITISRGRFSVVEYVDTIVHELVHAAQYHTNADILGDRSEMEKQADDLACEAMLRYRKEFNLSIGQ